ncbi:MAG: methyltransferase domain-containing protein [Thermodesulfobacteriota bacterium]
MTSRAKGLLSHPRTRGLSPDDPAVTAARVEIIRQKAFLRKVYELWYGMLARAVAGAPGPVLELGSGGGFFQERMPDLISSEVFYLPHVDLVCDARALCFAEGSLGGIVMLDVFHHLPDCGAFLSSAERCLRPGGRIAMIEPWATPFSGLVYRHLHPEPFEPDAQEWRAPPGGPLSGANQALPWIVFHRDRQALVQRHPGLELLKADPFMPFSYLLSGGVSSRLGLPGFAFSSVRSIERLLAPFFPQLAMFALIVLRRRAGKTS